MISAPAWQSTVVVGPPKGRLARGQDRARGAEEWDADDYLRRLVYLAVNTLILSLTVSGLLSLDTLGLG
jgi:hypothetical protein